MKAFLNVGCKVLLEFSNILISIFTLIYPLLFHFSKLLISLNRFKIAYFYIAFYDLKCSNYINFLCIYFFLFLRNVCNWNFQYKFDPGILTIVISTWHTQFSWIIFSCCMYWLIICTKDYEKGCYLYQWLLFNIEFIKWHYIMMES